MNLLRIFPAYRRLEQLNEKLRKDMQSLVMKEATIYDLEFADGSITAEMGSEMVQVIAGRFLAMFRESGAVNYMEWQFSPRKEIRGEIPEFVLTIQRKDGKTPHELRVEAERKLAELTSLETPMTMDPLPR